MVRTVCQIDECVAKAKDSSDPTVSSCDKADQDSGQDSFRDINFRFASSHAVSDVQKEVPCEGCNFVTRCDAESSTPGGSALDGNPLARNCGSDQGIANLGPRGCAELNETAAARLPKDRFFPIGNDLYRYHCGNVYLDRMEGVAGAKPCWFNCSNCHQQCDLSDPSKSYDFKTCGRTAEEEHNYRLLFGQLNQQASNPGLSHEDLDQDISISRSFFNAPTSNQNVERICIANEGTSKLKGTTDRPNLGTKEYWGVVGQMTFEPNEPQPQPELALLTGGLDVNQPVEESVLPGYLVEPFLAEESNELEARPVALRLNLAETWKQLFSNETRGNPAARKFLNGSLSQPRNREFMDPDMSKLRNQILEHPDAPISGDVRNPTIIGTSQWLELNDTVQTYFAVAECVGQLLEILSDGPHDFSQTWNGLSVSELFVDFARKRLQMAQRKLNEAKTSRIGGADRVGTLSVKVKSVLLAQTLQTEAGDFRIGTTPTKGSDQTADNNRMTGQTLVENLDQGPSSSGNHFSSWSNNLPPEGRTSTSIFETGGLGTMSGQYEIGNGQKPDGSHGQTEQSSGQGAGGQPQRLTAGSDGQDGSLRNHGTGLHPSSPETHWFSPGPSDERPELNKPGNVPGAQHSDTDSEDSEDNHTDEPSHDIDPSRGGKVMGWNPPERKAHGGSGGESSGTRPAYQLSDDPGSSAQNPRATIVTERPPINRPNDISAQNDFTQLPENTNSIVQVDYEQDQPEDQRRRAGYDSKGYEESRFNIDASRLNFPHREGVDHSWAAPKINYPVNNVPQPSGERISQQAESNFRSTTGPHAQIESGPGTFHSSLPNEDIAANDHNLYSRPLPNTNVKNLSQSSAVAQQQNFMRRPAPLRTVDVPEGSQKSEDEEEWLDDVRGLRQSSSQKSEDEEEWLDDVRGLRQSSSQNERGQTDGNASSRLMQDSQFKDDSDDRLSVSSSREGSEQDYPPTERLISDSNSNSDDMVNIDTQVPPRPPHQQQQQQQQHQVIEPEQEIKQVGTSHPPDTSSRGATDTSTYRSSALERVPLDTPSSDTEPPENPIQLPPNDTGTVENPKKQQARAYLNKAVPKLKGFLHIKPKKEPKPNTPPVPARPKPPPKPPKRGGSRQQSQRL